MVDTPSAAAVAGLPRVWRPRASPDGRYVAFFWNPGERYELYVHDVEAGEHRQLTDGEPNRSPNAPALWDPAGEALYFQTGEHGYDVGRFRRVTLDGNVESVAELGGGWGVLLDVHPCGEWLLHTRTPDDHQRLYRLDLATGEETRLSGPDTVVPSRPASVSPPGKRVSYPGKTEDAPGERRVFLVTGDGSERRRLPVSGSENVQPVTWHPTGEHLLVYDRNDHRAGEFTLGREHTRWFGPGRPVTYLDGRTVLAWGDPVRLYDRETGGVTKIDIPGFNGMGNLLTDGARLDDDRFLFTRRTERRPAELWVHDGDAGEGRALVDVDPGSVDPDAFVTAEAVSYESVGGRTVEALLYRPNDAGEPLPVVVEAHGFPVEADRRFDPKAQFLVARGYAVLQPNYRGGTARDAGFAASIGGDWGGVEQDDVAAAAEWLAEQDWAGGERLAIHGHSYGGFTAYTQMVRYPETWSVGIPSDGMTDLHALDAGKDGDLELREEMGHPRDDAALWRDRSPLTHVENVERPLLLLHGAADPTAPVSQARAFAGALESVRGWTEGEEFEYAELSSGEHGDLDRETHAERWSLLVDFLDRRL